MTSILLCRHGPVSLSAPDFPTRHEFERYVEAYELSGIRSDSSPPQQLIWLVREAVTVFSSPSLRATEYLRLLDPERVPVINAMFAEEPQIIPHLAGRWPLVAWFLLTRGFGAFHVREADSRRAMRQRAGNAANLLITAAEHGPMALMGHGWFNRAIDQALRQSGWRRVERCHGHGSIVRISSTWGYVVLEKEEPGGRSGSQAMKRHLMRRHHENSDIWAQRSNLL